MLRRKLLGKRKRGRPKRRFMDVVKEDVAVVEVTKEDTEVGTNGDEKSAVATLTREAERRRKKIQDKEQHYSTIVDFNQPVSDLVTRDRSFTNYIIQTDEVTYQTGHTWQGLTLAMCPLARTHF